MTVGRIPVIEGGIQPTIFDAKGDLLTASANDTPARLAVGANDLLVTAASGEATGLKYTGSWTTFTPTLTNLTLGNGTITGRYCQIGKVVFVHTKIVLGTTSSMGSYPTISLPLTPSSSGGPQMVALTDAGSTVFLGATYITPGFATTGPQRFLPSGGNVSMAAVDATNPFTWGNTDIIEYIINYEVA
jgi:hypothetical protein